jgi:hypothetical protein
MPILNSVSLLDRLVHYLVAALILGPGGVPAAREEPGRAVPPQPRLRADVS